VKSFKPLALACSLICGLSAAASADILAMLSYESKSPDSLKSLKLGGPQQRREGIAIMDVDPASANFGKILWDMPLPNDLTAHHIFYDRTMTKAYITALGKKELRVMDMTTSPYALKTMAVDCSMGEDVVFDEANKRWFLTCMDSGNVIVGDVATDAIIGEIKVPGTYPHGLAVNTAINRILITSTVSGDLSTSDERITEVDATSFEVLNHIKLSKKPSPSGEAPVEVLFVPGAEVPTAYITNMFGNTLWTATWNAGTGAFDTAQVYDFMGAEKVGVPLEIYFSADASKLYVTTANPGRFHIFDISENPGQPKHMKTLTVSEGAHHVGFTKDGKYAIVQNSFLNLPGMSSGLIDVVDLKTEEVVKTITTFADDGLNPNVIVLLPKWNAFAGH
jgi:DNA-binding beta-propeller fold protein YncE